jgi:2-oxoglutarate ferredoxin oxidoreductase subunit beta
MTSNLYPKLPATDASQQDKKDFQTNQDVRWCPGCGDYSILAQVQKVLPSFGIPKEDYVFVSGIGCSSRFPYYMETYGLHTIHGRAPAIATGIKSLRPNLKVWMVTGDGDALSIGGNHFIHLLRRNVDIKIMMFNNQIYGLTKGQYSPTSEFGKKTKSTPYGSVDTPFLPASVALGAGASFVARSIDTEVQHLQEMITNAGHFTGTAFLEIYQNCNIFNDGAYAMLTERATKADQLIYLKHGQPLLFGQGQSKGLMFDLEHFELKVVNVADVGIEKIMLHDETNLVKAQLLSRLRYPDFPTPIGVFYRKARESYDHLMHEQVQAAQKKKMSFQELLEDAETWEISAE